MTTSLDEVRARLREWAYVYRDRARLRRAGSAEGNWSSPQVWEAQKPRPIIVERQAYKTHELLKMLPTPNFRAITFRFCYPWVPLGIPLRHLTRRCGFRVTLKEYDELVLLGEYRLAAMIDKEREVDEMRELLARAVRAAA